MDDQLVGRWQVVGIDLVDGKALSLIGGLPGELVEFTADGRYVVGVSARKPSEYLCRTSRRNGQNQLDVWMKSMPGLVSRCLYRRDDGRLSICVAANHGPRPTAIRRDDRRLWCVMTLEQPDRAKAGKGRKASDTGAAAGAPGAAAKVRARRGDAETPRFFLLAPKDQRHNNWLLYDEDPQHGVRLRERYADLRCPNCGKVDVAAALARGVDPDVRVRSKSDYLETDDGVVCLSRRAAVLVKKNGVKGLRLVELPGDPAYLLALPAVFAPTDPATAGVRANGPEACDPLAALGLGKLSDFPRKADRQKRCVRCKRFFETVGLPAFASLRPPTDPMTVFASDLQLEHCRYGTTWLYATDKVVTVFKKAKLTGLEYNKLS